MSQTEAVLITGFPSFVAKQMILRYLGREEIKRIHVMVRYEEQGDAAELVDGLGERERRVLRVIVGEVTNMDLGLSGKEYRNLTTEVTRIHHIAGRFHLGVSKEAVEQYNVGGTRGVLELALECGKLERFCFWSTTSVSGDRDGVIMEDELELGQKFRNAFEHSKYVAEKIVRSMSRRVPSTILRPGLIVGHSKSGEIGRFAGPYHLMTVLMRGPFDLQLPLPGHGAGPLPIVPVDYVVDAAFELARMPNAVSRTFHLVDPCPLSARSVYELVADRSHRKIQRGVVPPQLAKALLKLPWLGRFKGSPRTVMEGFNQLVFYNCRNTLEALRGTNIWCPPFEDYVDNLIRFIKTAKPPRSEEDIVDPLD
jgi:thioester reductase-like protein